MKNDSVNLNEVAQGIVKALGTEWSVRPYEDTWREKLVGPAGAEVFISKTWSKDGFLHFSGLFPNGYQPREGGASINCSITKTPEQMARDIARRLLPAYNIQLEHALSLKRADEDFNAGKARLAEELSEILGVSIRQHHDQNPHLQVPDQYGYSLEVQSPNSVKINYNVSADFARKLAHLIIKEESDALL